MLDPDDEVGSQGDVCIEDAEKHEGAGSEGQAAVAAAPKQLDVEPILPIPMPGPGYWG